MNNILKIFVILITTVLFAEASAANPYLAADGSWISLRGTVVYAGLKSFELDYGEGIVTVEMDGWDWYDRAYPILEGDEVTVYGNVDDDLYETTSIEASSVYVKDLNTYFYASPLDDEEITAPVVTYTYYDADLQFTGKVTGKDGRELTLDTGDRMMTVDTSEMLYNPLDDKGFQKVSVGDRIQVTGDLDLDLFERQEIIAETITTLKKDKSKKN